MLLAPLVAACSGDAAVTSFASTRGVALSGDAGLEANAADVPLKHILQGKALPEGKVPVLEVVDSPKGARYSLFSGVGSLDGGPEVSESGFAELALSAATEPSDEERAVAPLPLPKVDARIASAVAAGADSVAVTIWLKEEASTPLFLELRKAVLRGDVQTIAERSALHERLLAERRAGALLRGSAIVQRLRRLEARIVYRCTNSPCILAKVPATALAALEQDEEIESVTLVSGEDVPSSPSGGTIGAASQLFFYPDEGYDGEGPVNDGNVQDEVILALLEVKGGAPDDEHFGFREGTGAGTRIHSRIGVIGDDFDTDVTFVFPSNFPQADESDHATGVLGVALGDLRDAQDPGVTSTATRRARSGYANEAEVHAIASSGWGGVQASFDLIPTLSPLPHVTNLSADLQPQDEEDPNCTGTTPRGRAANDLFEDGIFLVKTAGGNGHASSTDCRVGSPGSAIGSFTVGAYGDALDATTADVRAAPIDSTSSLGGTSSQGGGRRIIDMVAPSCRSDMFDRNGGYAYDACGTSFAAPQVSALALDLIDWDKTRSGAQDDLAHNPGLLHALLLLMGDRQSQGGKLLSGSDNLWGMGRLHARAFTNAGMDSPWYVNWGTTCVGSSAVNIPINHTPIGSIDVVKAAIYWYDSRHELGQAIDNLSLRLVNGSTGATIRSSSQASNESEFVYARSPAFGGLDTIQNVPLQLVIDPVSVTADNTSCGTNKMLVWYAYFFEDSDRDDADGPTIDQAPRE